MMLALQALALQAKLLHQKQLVVKPLELCICLDSFPQNWTTDVLYCQFLMNFIQYVDICLCILQRKVTDYPR